MTVVGERRLFLKGNWIFMGAGSGRGLSGPRSEEPLAKIPKREIQPIVRF
jgi:hypothetical protein